MPVDRTQLNDERTDALLRMQEEAGASAAGNPPPADYVAALRDVEQLGDADRVADAHADGNAPPDVGGGA